MQTKKLTIEEIDAELAELARLFKRTKKQSHLYTKERNQWTRREANLRMKRNQLVMRQLP